MNKTLSVIAILISLFGCNFQTPPIQNQWIKKYTIEQANSKDEFVHYSPYRIYDFQKDSLTITPIHFAPFSYALEKRTLSYSVEEKYLFLQEKKEHKLPYTILKNKLVIEVNDTPTKYRELFFEKLPAHQLSKEADEFQNVLLSSSFEIFDSTRVEFKKSGLVSPNYHSPFGGQQLWRITTYQNELFLVIDGYPGIALHINEIQEEGFTGTIYRKENKELFFKKISLERKFNLKNLLGQWIADAKEIIPPPLPDFPVKTKFLDREHLIITPRIIQKNMGYFRDQLIWESNREQDLLIFPETAKTSKKKHWKIISLNNTELVIERIINENNLTDSTTEQVKFRKK